jgi:hypothetical protein
MFDEVYTAPEDFPHWGSRRAGERLSWPRMPAEDAQGLHEPADDRTALVLLLIHTARALAASQITIENGFERIAICAACGEQTPAGIPARHRMTCLAAEVQSIVARLCQTLDANTQGKEKTLSKDVERASSAGQVSRPSS